MIINEIFTSIDGEVSRFHQGTMSTFIRFAGCNLKCPYCDTQYAQQNWQGKEYSVEEVLDKVQEIGCKKVTITGGEPLLQKDELLLLIRNLYSKGYKITVETNGSIAIPPAFVFELDIDGCPEEFCWAVDYKLWCWEKMITRNYLFLNENDWIKFVLQSPQEYVLAKETIGLLRDKGCRARMALSPAFGMFDPVELILMIKNDRFWDVTVNLQLHKIIWSPDERGV